MSIMSDKRMLKVIIKKPKARHQKDYNKHAFLQLIVETAMKKEKMDINTPNHIDHKLRKKIDDMRNRRGPILVNPQQSKKPRFSSSCDQPPLMEKEAHFKEVVDVEEEKVVMVSKDVDDDYDYEKEVMNKKTTKKSSDDNNNNKGKKTCKLRKEVVEVDDDDDYDYEKEVMKKEAMKSSTDDKNKKKKNMGMKKKMEPLLPPPLPNDEVCKLMFYRISEIGGTCPVWLAAKYMQKSDVSKHLGRLFIPKCCADVLLESLTQEERDFLIEEDKKIVKVGIPCRVVDQNGERWDIQLRYWPSVKQFIFISNWNNVVNGFGLKKENPGKIELWCFRLTKENSNLSFGLRITS